MKIGDKLYCIQTKLNTKLDVIHLKGKQYTICKIVQDVIYLTVENYLYQDKFGYWDNNLSNYFVTQQELRKLKLNKLNENRR